MGSLLLILLGMALAGCASQPSISEDDPHGSIPCSSCHAGVAGPQGIAAVPSDACKAAGCHLDGGPEMVWASGVGFPHRGHGAGAVVEPWCSGCHAHQGGKGLLVPTWNSCVLCHKEQVVDPDAQDCGFCHGASTHVAHSQRGLGVVHAWAPGDQPSCTRCHHDVGTVDLHVPADRCTPCHPARQHSLESWGERDRHLEHTGYSCRRCHTVSDHHIRAMSSAIDLVCADCHGKVDHGDEDINAITEPNQCLQCHEDIHVDQQKLVLGLVDGEPNHPSVKFLAGLTCRSCHATDPDATGAKHPRDVACGDCHDPHYLSILQWWRAGLERRLTIARDHLTAARADLAAAALDTVEASLDHASGMLDEVQKGGGEHNLELSDWVFRRSVELAESAYRLAGKTPPPTPDLGPAPRAGFCSFCHYDWVDPHQLARPMPENHAVYFRTR